MRVQTLTSDAAFDDLQEEWLHLLSQVPFQSVFFTPQWHATWWRHCGAGHQLHLLTIRSETGELQGLAPLMIAQPPEAPRRLQCIGDLEICDYLDVLIAPAHQREVSERLISAVVEQLDDDMELWLPNLARYSPTPMLLQDGLAAHGLAVKVKQIETCPSIPLPDSWDAYLGMLRGKDRHEMRRKMRRAEAAATLECTTAIDGASLDANLETFFMLHRLSRQRDKRHFMTEAKAAFFRDMAHQLWPQGWFEVACLHADGVPVAALCCFTLNDTYAAYNASYHPDYGHLSAGIVLFANRIRSAIDRGFTWFDFLRGDEPYKYRFGATDQPLYELVARTPCAVPGGCQ